MQASQTGHLVLSTLHTNDAISAITRLRDLGIPGFLISSSILAIIAQRLVRVLCPHCKKKTELSEDTKIRWKSMLGSYHLPQAYTAVGCERCNKTGYKGRMGIYEIVTINEALRSLIADNAPETMLRKSLRESGFHTLIQDGISKVEHGFTTPEEILRVVLVEDALQMSDSGIKGAIMNQFAKGILSAGAALVIITSVYGQNSSTITLDSNAVKQQLLSVDVKDTDIRDVIRMISKGYNLNILLDQGVTGKVTLHLVDVPIMEGLKSIAESNGLAVVKDGNVYKIQKATAEEKNLIRYSDGKLTVDVQNVNVKEFLKELSSKTAISIVPESKVDGLSLVNCFRLISMMVFGQFLKETVIRWYEEEISIRLKLI